MARVLIAGCGDVGCRLARELLTQGDEVFAIRRNIEQLPEGVQGIQGDLACSDCEEKVQLPDGIEYVFYLVSADRHNDIAYYRAYVAGQRNLLKLLEGQPVKRYVFSSSTSVFSQNEGEWVDEDSPVEGRNFASRALLEGEELVRESGLPHTIVRFGGIYGPGRTHLIDLVRSGKAACMEGLYSNRIHVEDAARLLAHIRNLENPAELYVGVDNEPVELCEVYEWLAEQMALPLPEHRELSETARQQRGNKRICNARIRETGFTFKYPTYREGYGAVLEEMEQAGLL